MKDKGKYITPLLITLFYAGFPFIGLFISFSILIHKEVPIKEKIKNLLTFSPLWFIWFAPRYRISAYIIATLISFVVWGSIIIISQKLKPYKFPFFFTLIFYIFSLTPLGNFWLNLSAANPVKSFILPILGLGFVNILIGYFGVLIYYLYKSKKHKVKWFIGLIAILLLLLIPPQHTNTSNTKIKVAAIQGCLLQDYFERQDLKKENTELYLNLSTKSLEKKPKIITWPEYVFTHAIQWDYELLSKIINFTRTNNVTLIFGANFFDATNRYNSAFIINKNNISVYKALYVVPFIDKDSRTVKTPAKITINNISIGIAMCYEENIPEVFIKEITLNNASFFLVLGNLYKMGFIGLRSTSLNIRDIAAITNRYIIRVENVGITEVIDNKGNVIKKIPFGEKGILYYEIPTINSRSFYVKHHKIIDSLLITTSLIMILFI